MQHFYLKFMVGHKKYKIKKIDKELIKKDKEIAKLRKKLWGSI